MDEPYYYLSADDPIPRDAVHVIVCGSVTVVEPRAFEGHEHLARVGFEEGVEEVGTGAFANCPNLTRVDCRASSLRTIDDDAFAGCERLLEVILGVGLQKIGECAFSECGLRRITVPSSVVEIGAEAFFWCPLSKVNLQEGLRWIGEAAFKSCRSLRQCTVPSSVVEIGDKAFAGCDNLEAVTLAGGMVMVASEAFLDCPRLEPIAISSMAIVVEAGEDGNGITEAVTGGISRDPENESPRLIMASPHLALMRPEDLTDLTDAVDRIAATTRGADPLDLGDGDLSGRIRECFVDRLSTWYGSYKREAATILELGLWKIELGRAAGGDEAGVGGAPTRDDCRRTCGADPIVELVLSSLAGPHRRADQGEDAGSTQP